MPSQSPVRVYFLSSGCIGIPLLDALYQDTRLNLVGVGSQPDKPAGRKKRLVATPLAAHAAEMNLTVDKPLRVNTPEFLDHLHSLNIDVLIVASFGQILRTALLDLPKFGCLNVHASLLPKWRGASPISAVILNGDQETGVTFMKMDPGLDTGPVYCKSSCPIDPTEDVISLEAKLGKLAAASLGNVVCQIVEGSIQPVPQPAEGSTYAKRIAKTDGAADWSLPAEILARKVRAYYAWPSLFAFLPCKKDKKDENSPVINIRISIKQAEAVNYPHTSAPGTVLEANAQGFVIACGQGALSIVRLIPEGRNEMSAADFLRGTALADGAVLPSCTGDFPLNEANSNQ